MNDSEKWKREFEAFLGVPEKPVPDRLSRLVRTKVHQYLYPSALRVFFYLAGVHLFAGSLTLLVCPQFGVGPLGGWLDLMQVVMPLGVVACAVFCGTLYLGTTALAAHVVFSSDLLRALEQTRYRQFALLAGGSVGVFMLLSLPISLPLPEIGFTFFWFLGGAILSQWIFHLAFRLRGLKPMVAG